MDLIQFIIFIDANVERLQLLILQSVCMNVIPLGKHRFVLYFPICVNAILKEGGRKRKEQKKGRRRGKIPGTIANVFKIFPVLNLADEFRFFFFFFLTADIYMKGLMHEK